MRNGNLSTFLSAIPVELLNCTIFVYYLNLRIKKKELKNTRHISAIITAVTGDRVIVGKEELLHAMKHFVLPEDIFLELLERIL